MITLPLVLASLYLVAAPNFDLIRFAEAYDEKRLLQLALLAVVVAIAFVAGRVRDATLAIWTSAPATVRTALVLVAAAGCLSALSAEHPRIAFLEVGLTALLFFLTLAIAASVAAAPERMQRLASAAVCLASALFLIDAGARYAAALIVGGGEPPLARDLFARFEHVRFFTQWQTWTLALTSLPRLLLPPEMRIARFATAVVAIGWWSLLFVSGTRGTALGVACGFAFVALAFGGSARTWLREQLSFAAAGLLVYLAGYLLLVDDWTAFLASFGHLASVSDSGRREIWGAAIDLIVRHPLLGAGPQHFRYYPELRNAHPHNLTLQWCAEWGIPSLLLVLTVCGTAFVAWVACVRRMQARPPSPRNVVAVALTAALTAGLVHAQLSGLAVMPLSQVLAALVVGWCWGIFVQERGRARTRASRRAHAALLLVLLGAATAVAVGAPPPEGVASFGHHPHADGSEERFRPRFWRRTDPPPPAAPQRPDAAR